MTPTSNSNFNAWTAWSLTGLWTAARQRSSSKSNRRNSNNDSIHHSLVEACRRGDTATVKLLLDENNETVSSPYVFHCDDNNNQQGTPLHVAAAANNPEIVELCLRLGADPKAQDDHGRTALHVACANHTTSTRTQRPRQQQQPRRPRTRKGGFRAIFLPKGKKKTGQQHSIEDQKQCIQRLLQANPDLLHVRDHRTPLFDCIKDCVGPIGLSWDLVPYMVEACGADVAVLDYDQNNLIHAILEDANPVLCRQSYSLYELEEIEFLVRVVLRLLPQSVSQYATSPMPLRKEQASDYNIVFTCPICCDEMPHRDRYVLTKCSHECCRNCLQTILWPTNGHHCGSRKDRSNNCRFTITDRLCLCPFCRIQVAPQDVLAVAAFVVERQVCIQAEVSRQRQIENRRGFRENDSLVDDIMAS